MHLGLESEVKLTPECGDLDFIATLRVSVLGKCIPLISIVLER